MSPDTKSNWPSFVVSKPSLRVKRSEKKTFVFIWDFILKIIFLLFSVTIDQLKLLESIIHKLYLQKMKVSRNVVNLNSSNFQFILLAERPARVG
jgi:hypothetical protein